jgi:Fic family protein
MMFDNILMTATKEVTNRLFVAPALDERELGVLAEIESLKKALRFQLHEPRRWSGALRRMAFARNVQGSNSIEGYDAALDDAAALALGEEPLDASTETKLALEGYISAMTYVLQIVQEPPVIVSLDLVKSLHFMMTSYDLKNRPGRWRAGAIFVQDERTGDTVHEGADLDLVPPLMASLVESMLSDEDNALIRAAMAHLNLVMIHPFRDGNGRMARCLQSLVLAADGVLAPVFMSVEEYLGRNTQAYYDVLAAVGGGGWNPGNDTRPWIRFMLTAHLRQARTLQRRVKASEQMWLSLEKLVEQHHLPDRAIAALFDAAFGLRVRRSTYTATLVEMGEEVSDQTATRDLQALVDSGLVIPFGEKRGRYYNGSAELRDLRQRALPRRVRDDSDPFAD